jgi:hypothetical protein
LLYTVPGDVFFYWSFKLDIVEPQRQRQNKHSSAITPGTSISADEKTGLHKHDLNSADKKTWLLKHDSNYLSNYLEHRTTAPFFITKFRVTLHQKLILKIHNSFHVHRT